MGKRPKLSFVGNIAAILYGHKHSLFIIGRETLFSQTGDGGSKPLEDDLSEIVDPLFTSPCTLCSLYTSTTAS